LKKWSQPKQGHRIDTNQEWKNAMLKTQNPRNSLFAKVFGTPHLERKVLYTARVHTTGGRDGASRSWDGRLDIKHSTPGSVSAGTNPEQLFAAGWSACFEGAMALAARRMKVALPALVDAARQTCPYSKATRGNIEVMISLV
jgi:osmotically inducible protein OsmC